MKQTRGVQLRFVECIRLINGRRKKELMRCAGGVRQWRRATVATPRERQCKTGGVRRLAVANGPNIFQMLLVKSVFSPQSIGLTH